MFNHPSVAEPRASRIPINGRDDIRTSLWMGGADSLHGDLVTPEDLRDAWVIDLAGDMPAVHRQACAQWHPSVFADIEGVPHGYERLTALASSVAACMTGGASVDGWPHTGRPPERIYVMCQQGMNRSGLLTGLILRALGVDADTALAAIATRPGALSNQTYVRLVRAWGVNGDTR